MKRKKGEKNSSVCFDAMKSAIIYYSFSGNTRKVAEALAEYLRQWSEAELIELKALDESPNFFGQAARAFRHTKASIDPVNLNLTGFDLVCFGTPVWAFGPAPAMNAYLDTCLGTERKEIILFTTYGSGSGNERCLDHMQKVLTQKGGGSFKRFSVQQFKVNDKDFILSKISGILTK